LLCKKPENMYETGHLFTCLLLKEIVDNDVIFAYDKITLRLKMLTKEDKTLMKNAWESKKYAVK